MKAGTSLERYQLEDMLGEGGVGVVYRARHVTLGTAHALKIVTVRTPAQRQRVVREARIQARMRHPNVVRVTDIIELDEQIALVAELVEGPSLADMIEHERLPLPLALGLFAQMLDGIEAAHELGIVHRDLKPHNVLVARDEDRLVARISDFGIARARDEALDVGLSTRTGVAMGTPAYMAPEQHLDAGAVDARADIYSLGCILYELCVGGRPFCATSIVQLAQACAAEDYPRPRALEPSLDPELEQLIVDCLRADPDRRPATCGEVRRRLLALGLAASEVPARLSDAALRAPGAGQTLE
ncbi:serine/threonine protein kinase, partial [Myxococcota bacterium]|nr:serine/threonine protein kinase [Myxococcota bacterium]